MQLEDFVSSFPHAEMFQYRKRYGLHAILVKKVQEAAHYQFQYRKRYGLHAMGSWPCLCHGEWSFNTASGMDCMQSVSE